MPSLSFPVSPTPWGWGRSRDSGWPVAGQRCLTLVLGQRRRWHDGHPGTAGRGRMVAWTARMVPRGRFTLQPSCCLPCPGPSRPGPPQPSSHLQTAHAARVHPRGAARAHGRAQWARGAQREGTAGGHLWGPADQGEQERASEADSDISKGSPGGQGEGQMLVWGREPCWGDSRGGSRGGSGKRQALALVSPRCTSVVSSPRRPQAELMHPRPHS